MLNSNATEGRRPRSRGERNFRGEDGGGRRGDGETQHLRFLRDCLALLRPQCLGFWKELQEKSVIVGME